MTRDLGGLRPTSGGGGPPDDAGLRLVELVRELPGAVTLHGDGEVRVRGVHHDSRRVGPGDLFVARRGQTSDGTAFVPRALQQGAVAILAATGAVDPASLPVPSVLVDDVTRGLAYAAAAVYGHPSFSLEVVGITGTNGKTTTAHLVRAAVDGALGTTTCAVLGTVGHWFGAERIPAEHTTPEADEIARVMACFRRAGAGYVAMEASSIALEAGRVAAVRFRVAAFTNFTQDHLDYHHTMEAYGAAKARLFRECGPGAAVINVADPFGARLAADVRAPLVRVSPVVATPPVTGQGTGAAGAHLAPVRANVSARGIDATLRTPFGELDLQSPLLGAHNLENLMVALGVVHALGLDLERAAAALATVGGAPGRLERCDGAGDDVVVVVDYAHTPDALAKVLLALRRVAPARVICVFGCGGDRDAGKRGPMGEAAATGADVVVITSDNPRTEDPAVIAGAAEVGVARHKASRSPDELTRGASGYTMELDRGSAIALAIAAAAPRDVVLVAGKGHEDYQVVGTEKRPFDDRAECRRALAERRAGRGRDGGGR